MASELVFGKLRQNLMLHRAIRNANSHHSRPARFPLCAFSVMRGDELAYRDHRGPTLRRMHLKAVSHRNHMFSCRRLGFEKRQIGRRRDAYGPRCCLSRRLSKINR